MRTMEIFTIDCVESELNEKIKEKFIELGFDLKTTTFDTEAVGPSFMLKEYTITAYPKEIK